jgi:sigma-54 dependent transcriptional regulator, acetoin dehydrogenase operon transcriptional activator AcoR
VSDLPSDVTAPSSLVESRIVAQEAQDKRLAHISSLKHAEVILIENSLAQYKGNISKAAIALGISRPTLYRKIQASGLRGDLRNRTEPESD